MQVISFPVLGAAFTTTANIYALQWNGSIGGIIAFQVTGNLNLNHSILANGAGFRGGAKAGPDGSACQNNMWATSSGNPRYADKGEGVYVPSSAQTAGKAKAVNGGGGGIVHNF